MLFEKSNQLITIIKSAEKLEQNEQQLIVVGWCQAG